MKDRLWSIIIALATILVARAANAQETAPYLCSMTCATDMPPYSAGERGEVVVVAASPGGAEIVALNDLVYMGCWPSDPVYTDINTLWTLDCAACDPNTGSCHNAGGLLSGLTKRYACTGVQDELLSPSPGAAC